MQEEFSDFIRFLANRAYRLISICPVALNILFDLIQSSGAGGSRTRVQKLIHYSFFHHSQCFNISSAYRPLTCYRP